MWAKMKVIKRKACPGDANAPLPPEGRLLGERPGRVLRRRAWKSGLARAGCAECCTAELGLCRVDSRTPVEGWAGEGPSDPGSLEGNFPGPGAMLHWRQRPMMGGWVGSGAQNQ